MSYKHAHSRLRQAVAFLHREKHRVDRQHMLQEAWLPLYSLREEDFPDELRGQFGYLRHEMSRLEGDQRSNREINLLMLRYKIFELKWIEQLQNVPLEDFESD